MNMDELRGRIDAVDDELLRCFAERMDIAGDIARYKAEHGLPVLDERREREKLYAVSEKAPEELQSLKARARAYILPRARSLALSLNIGTDARFGVTAARTRFGSCSQSNSINFSCFLALYPDECIDYVIIHELCHTVHKNHSRAFYSLLERCLPDRKERERLLRTL